MEVWLSDTRYHHVTDAALAITYTFTIGLTGLQLLCIMLSHQ